MDGKVESFVRAAGGIRRVFHQLRVLAELASPPMPPGFTPAHRGVLESLFHHGPETVPALARARPVARQHIQVLVNDLVEMGLVELRPNPAHKRSPLVALTDRGRRSFDDIRKAELAFLRKANLPLAPAKLDRLAKDLEALSAALQPLLEQRSS